MTSNRSHSSSRPHFLRRTAGVPIVVATAVLLAACTSGSGAGSPDASTGGSSSAARSSGTAQDGGTDIRITIGDQTMTGHLNDSATARDLASRLPLTVQFGDYDDNEKVGHMDPALSTDGAPSSADPVPGEIGYYAPWDNLVLYNGDVGRFSGIIRIGTFDGDRSLIADQDGDFSVRIERA